MKAFDFLVIGAGSGGVRASRLASSFGARVGLIEKSKLGGTCVNLGCVPKKLFVYASEFAHYPEIAKGYGWNFQGSFEWQKLIENKNREIDRLGQIYKKLLSDHGVSVFYGEAELIAENKVRIGDKVFEAKKILLATGSTPVLPKIEGIQHAQVSDEIFFLKQLPKSITIVGAGYIAIEFAGIFQSLGVETTLVHRSKTLLRNFEREAVEHLIEEMQKKGVRFCLEKTITKITKKGEQKVLEFQDGSKSQTDLLFYAIGRKPNLKGLHLEKWGVKLAENGGVAVNNPFFQTSNKNIYAIGDMINQINLTPVAIRQGVVVANALFNNKKINLDYQNIPTAIFSQPNLASVGYTEQEARKKYDIEVYKTKVTPMKYSLCSYKEKALLKLIVDKKTNKILGVHMVGADAGEIIQIFAVAINSGCTKEDLDNTISLHPSLAEEWVTMH